MSSSFNCHRAILYMYQEKSIIVSFVVAFRSIRTECKAGKHVCLPVKFGLVYRSIGFVDIVCANELTIISKRHKTSASSVSIETSSLMASTSPAFDWVPNTFFYHVVYWSSLNFKFRDIGELNHW